MLVVSEIAGRDVTDRGAVGGDHRDAAVDQCADADVAIAVDGQRVEQLVARQAGEAHRRVERRPRAASWPGEAIVRWNTRPLWVSAQYSLEPSGDRPMPFGRFDRMHLLADVAAIGRRVVDAGEIARPCRTVADAVIGEPEAAVGVEDEIIGRAQRSAVALACTGR